MAEFNVQSESIDVERIMEQIRSRIKEKRGEDYTEDQIRELAGVKLERFLDPDNVRSDLVERYREQRKGSQTKLAFPETLREPPPAPESYAFDPDIIYRSSRGLAGRILYGIRKALSPVLKFFINVGPIVHALHVQREINERQNEAINWMVQTQAEFIDRVTKLFEMSSSRLAAREEIDALNYELMNNLVVEMTRLSIEMKNHRMRVESVAGRLDFNERRARALEGVVQYREGARSRSTEEGGGTADAGGTADGSAPKRRRRRRGRRRPPRPEGAAPEGATGETGGPETQADQDVAAKSSGSSPEAPPPTPEAHVADTREAEPARPPDPEPREAPPAGPADGETDPDKP